MRPCLTTLVRTRLTWASCSTSTTTSATCWPSTASRLRLRPTKTFCICSQYDSKDTTFWKDVFHNDLTMILFHVLLILQLSLDLYYTEDEIYELSYTKEPKNPKIQVRLTQVSLKFTTFKVSHNQSRLCALLSVGVTSSKQTVILAAE